jgi:drug/metabolite transporter (DMT)-like permease
LGKTVTIALLAGTVVNSSVNGPDTLRAAAAMPLSAWLLMAYLVVICTVVGYMVWFVVIRETEVNVTVLTVFLQPVVGLGIAMLALGESLRWSQLWGSAVIVMGLTIGLSRQIRRTQLKGDSAAAS